MAGEAAMLCSNELAKVSDKKYALDRSAFWGLVDQGSNLIFQTSTEEPLTSPRVKPNDAEEV